MSLTSSLMSRIEILFITRPFTALAVMRLTRRQPRPDPAGPGAGPASVASNGLA